MIRHRYDYGAILLCDERYVILLNVSIANISRFASKNIRDQLSLWLRPHVAGIPINILMYLIEKDMADFGRAARTISAFFRHTVRFSISMNIL